MYVSLNLFSEVSDIRPVAVAAHRHTIPSFLYCMAGYLSEIIPFFSCSCSHPCNALLDLNIVQPAVVDFIAHSIALPQTIEDSIPTVDVEIVSTGADQPPSDIFLSALSVLQKHAACHMS